MTNRSSGSVRVAAPLNANLAPPGYYMIHVLNGSNIPSVAKIIQIPGTGSGTPDTTPPVQVAGLIGTTTPLATPTANLYQNTGLSPSTTYYYKVSAVDNAGNIGPLSAERSGITNASSDTTIPSVAITSPANNAFLAPGNIIVQGTASDNPGGSGIFDVQVRTDNNAWVIATPKSAGNWSTWSITV